MTRESERRRSIRRANVEAAGRMVDWQAKHRACNRARYLKRLIELYTSRKAADLGIKKPPRNSNSEGGKQKNTLI